jgi:hypothetical protein
MDGTIIQITHQNGQVQSIIHISHKHGQQGTVIFKVDNASGIFGLIKISKTILEKVLFLF